MGRLQLGIIGCGVIGSVHARSAAESEQIELVAVADVQRELAEKTAAAHGVETVYNEGAALLADARVEAVVLALPASFRIELGLEALRAGKHLLTEKPVARSAAEVRQLIAAQGEDSWEVIGDAGSLRLWMTPAEEKEILYFESSSTEGTVRRTLWAGEESFGAVGRALLEDFATAVRTGRPPKTTLTQALLVQRLTDALYRSAERGEAVEISAL